MKSIQVGLFPRRQKEPFDQMSARSPIPTNVDATHECVLSTRPQAQSQSSSWRQVFRPYAFWIVGLAIAVFLWGYGYKLSLYHCHARSSSHATVAKLWIEPRTASVAAASRLKTILHFVSRAQAVFVTIQRLPSMCRNVARILRRCERHAVFFDLLVPSRAPPPLRFRLA
jgi:hypothetical protein